MTPRSAHGIALVAVLLVSSAVWLLLASLLVTVRLQLLVAVAARDHRLAADAALVLVERAREHDWWAGGAPPVESGGGGTCAWTLTVDGVDDERARYAAEVRFGRASVRIDATAHRPR